MFNLFAKVKTEALTQGTINSSYPLPVFRQMRILLAF